MTARTRLLVAALAIVQVLVLSVATATAGRRWLAAPLDGDDAYVVLVLGSDEGPPRTGSARTGRADGFHLLVVDGTRTHVSILSIPRDTYAAVPGFGSTKINASLVHGPENAVAAAEQLTGLEVDDWILTGFHGLIAAIDELGGLQITVEERLHDPHGSSSDLQPGPQRLSGWQTLAYTRDRKSRRTGDLGRAESHARVLQAAHAQLLGDGPDARRIAEVVSLVRRHTETSIPADRMFRLVALAMTIPSDHVSRARIDGVQGRAGGASVMRIGDQAEALFADLRDDGILDLGVTGP